MPKSISFSGCHNEVKKLLSERFPSVAHGLSRLQCDDDAWNVTGLHLYANRWSRLDIYSLFCLAGGPF